MLPPLHLSQTEIKKLNWRGIPSKVFSLCAPQCDTVIGERGFAVHLQAKKKKRVGAAVVVGWVGGGGVDAGNYHKTNNERLCRKVFEERP